MMSNQRLGYDVTDPTVQVLRASAFMQNGPVKQVRSLEDLDRWVRSQAYHDTIAYINHTSRAIQGHRMSRNPERNFDFPVSEQMRRLCEIFDGLDHLLVEHTPKPEEDSLSMAAGSSYKTWMQHMSQHVFSKLDEAIRANCKHINELGQYLRRSFGNLTTMDFGPANELMFLFFLCGLFRAGILLANDTIAAALLLFNRYIHLVRRLVATYGLKLSKDPMSSIDDYCLLPYLWGAAQLSLDPPFAPMQCEEQHAIRLMEQDYMMLELVEHLQRSRGGGQLSQVAFPLWSLLSLPTWPQVYRGLERNYIDTVLCSFHTLEQAIFCELMSFEAAVPPASQLERAYLGAQYLERRRRGEEDGNDEEEDQSASLWEASPPVSRYVSMEPESFLGFQEPKAKSKSKANEEEDEDSEEEHHRLWMLRQVVDEKDPNNAMFFPDRGVNPNDSVTSVATEGP